MGKMLRIASLQTFFSFFKSHTGEKNDLFMWDVCLQRDFLHLA